MLNLHPLVVLGTAGALVARQTGEAIEESLEATGVPVPQLMAVHSAWSLIATWIFSTLAAAYLAAWIYRAGYQELRWLANVGRICDGLLRSWPTALLALAGLAAITATGALGAALVYGPEIDPAVNAIFGLLVGR